MVAIGKARAQGLGWPDAYAYSKALGERALLETRGDLPVTIVRPSIIESALAEPQPGWIRGFRMADPVIKTYISPLDPSVQVLDPAIKVCLVGLPRQPVHAGRSIPLERILERIAAR